MYTGSVGLFPQGAVCFCAFQYRPCGVLVAFSVFGCAARIHKRARAKGGAGVARPKVGMTPRKWAAARLLGQGIPNHKVIEQLKIPETTLYRWMRDDVFIDAITLESNRFLAVTAPRARRVLSDQMGADNDWLAQNAANSVLRERSAVEGTAAQQVVITFAADDTDPGMPVPDEVPLDDADADA